MKISLKTLNVWHTNSQLIIIATVIPVILKKCWYFLRKFQLLAKRVCGRIQTFSVTFVYMIMIVFVVTLLIINIVYMIMMAHTVLVNYAW